MPSALCALSTDSIELRIEDDGNVVCAWGSIDHADPRPDRNEVGHLIIATPGVVDETLRSGPVHLWRSIDDDGRVLWQEYSATTHGDRTFLHTAYPIYSHGEGILTDDGAEKPPTVAQRWTWELFPAHWWDGDDQALLIGRWPD